MKASQEVSLENRNPFLNPFGEVDCHERYLPHWQQGDAWQFVTWRLADSLPQSKLMEWRSERDAWLARHPEPWDDAVTREFHERFSSRMDQWLDTGHGSCVLRHTSCAEVVAGALRHFHGERYALGAFVVMPNHVHVLFSPRPGCDLADIVQSWKSYTAKEINKLLGRKGTLWQEEYWDRLVRHGEHLAACLRYIEEHPAKAHLRSGQYVLENYFAEQQ